MAGFIYRENKVPYYQRFYQKNEHVRLWMRHPRSPMLVYPFMTMVAVGALGGVYGMIRMAAGKKTFY